MKDRRLLHEGKVKRVYEDPTSKDKVIIEFVDTVTAGDGAKKAEFQGKGKICLELSEFFFNYLERMGIQTHLLERIDDNHLRCRRVGIFPVEIVVRNVAAGSFCKRYGIEKGIDINPPLVELFVKDDSLHDPPISQDAVLRLGLATTEEIGFMKSIALSVNYYMSELLEQIDLKLIDFKLEFGRTADGRILLADEISGDTIRVWNKEKRSLDKDLFRKDEGDIVTAYAHLLERLRTTSTEKVVPRTETVSVTVFPKDGIKNPPGDVTRKALVRLGLEAASEVRMGKTYRITLDRPLNKELLDQLETMNLKLLSNPIAEKHHVRLSE